MSYIQSHLIYVQSPHINVQLQQIRIQSILLYIHSPAMHIQCSLIQFHLIYINSNRSHVYSSYLCSFIYLVCIQSYLVHIQSRCSYPDSSDLNGVLSGFLGCFLASNRHSFPNISRKNNFTICETVHSIKKDLWYSHFSQRSRRLNFDM